MVGMTTTQESGEKLYEETVKALDKQSETLERFEHDSELFCQSSERILGARKKTHRLNGRRLVGLIRLLTRR